MPTTNPALSVVLAVFNGDRYLERSIDSVLSQEGVDFELVAVNDGSTDSTSDILERALRRDSRLRVLHQDNQGLTRSLIRGCAEARGELIARQDADDLSLPGRLAAQQALLQTQPSITLAGCWTRFIGPEDEQMGVWDPPSDHQTATRALRSMDLKTIRGLGGHGSAMFRRQDYLRVGGYRAPFYYAQDIDLWLRLTEIGSLALVPTILYCWRFGSGSITWRARGAQVRTAALILQAAEKRQRGEDEGPTLALAAQIRPDAGVDRRGLRSREGAGQYFIGRRLLRSHDARAAGYLKRAAMLRPWHVPSWLALALACATARGEGRR